jgi:hypothetical protein
LPYRSANSGLRGNKGLEFRMLLLHENAALAVDTAGLRETFKG